MLKKKNGFVVSLKMMIIILIIIIVISIPIVNTIIFNSQKNAMIDIAKEIDDAAYRYFIAHLGQNITLDLSKDMDKIGLAGAKREGGIIKIESTGNVSFAIYNDKWCVIKKDSNSNYKIKSYIENECTLP